MVCIALTRRDGDLMALALELHSEHVGESTVVFDDKGSIGHLWRLPPQRQFNGNRRPKTKRAFDVDSSTVLPLNDFHSQRQSQANPTFRLLERPKSLRRAFDSRRVHAAASVGDRHPQVFRVRLYLDHHSASLIFASE